MKSSDFIAVKYLGWPLVVLVGLFLIGRNTWLLMASDRDLNLISAV